MILVLIISFVKIGTGETIQQNNGFFCLIICAISFLFQIKYQPFMTKDLNNLNEKASFIAISTIFLGLFGSFCENSSLEFILLIILISVNFSFVLMTMKKYLQIKITFSQKSKFFKFLKAAFARLWSKGKFFTNI